MLYGRRYRQHVSKAKPKIKQNIWHLNGTTTATTADIIIMKPHLPHGPYWLKTDVELIDLV